MSQIIIIERVAALAEQIEQTYLHHGSMKIKQAVLACLHPIEVPSDAVELVDKVREGAVQGHTLSSNYWKLNESDAAALITARERVVPTAMLEEVWIHGHDYAFDKTISANIDKIIEKYGYRAE